MLHKLICLLFMGICSVAGIQAQPVFKTLDYQALLPMEVDTMHRVHFSYERTEGKLTGIFNAYYPSGMLKATGTLENGLRKGEWRVYFEDGSLAIKRFYHQPTKFEALYPALPKKGPAALFGRYTPEPLTRDSAGFIPFTPVKEMDIEWEKRIFRWIPVCTENRILFGNDLLWNTLWEAVRHDKFPAYSITDAKFRTRLPFDSIKSMDVSQLKLLGLEIKEIFYFNKQTQAMHVVILGIRPVFIHTISQDTVRLFWLYYPQIRGLLATKKLSEPQLPGTFENLDDVFHFRHFSSTIFHEIDGAGPDKGFPTYYHEASSLSITESENIELGIIETDLTYWAFFNSKAYKQKKK